MLINSSKTKHSIGNNKNVENNKKAPTHYYFYGNPDEKRLHFGLQQSGQSLRTGCQGFPLVTSVTFIEKKGEIISRMKKKENADS